MNNTVLKYTLEWLISEYDINRKILYNEYKELQADSPCHSII